MPRGEGEAAAEAVNRLVTPKNEPSASTEVGSTASNMRLLTTSWMNAEAGTSGRGDFVASTIDVDAIKRSPERFAHNSKKEPLMTIPENWASIDPNPCSINPHSLPLQTSTLLKQSKKSQYPKKMRN